MWESVPALRAELGLFEQLLHEQFKSKKSVNSYLDGLSLDMIKSGGKRLRPALTISAAMLGRYERSKVLYAALSVELLHTATLVHDDIIDRSPLRRNSPTVFARDGVNTAVFAGDYLFIKSILALSGTGLPTVYLEQLARATEAVCVGEVEQFKGRGALPGIKTYLSRITRKTGFLFAACCACGAHLGGLNEDGVKCSARFGSSFGAAFQIKDDLLDILGTKSAIGKPTGSDIKEGVFTLPVLLAAAKDEGTKDMLERYIGGTDKAQHNEEIIMQLRENVIRSGADKDAASVLKKYISRAEGYRKRLPQSPGSDMLFHILQNTFKEYQS